ncbi:DUF4433 domain-containing protein [bacterium]|nr:DUF4433 domain-containing protein [bacterium]
MVVIIILIVLFIAFLVNQGVQSYQYRRDVERGDKIRDLEKVEEKRVAKEEEERINAERSKKKEIYNIGKKRIDWHLYDSILLKYDIHTLYHFTDRSNIDSIKYHRALLSWSYCDKNGILISKPGGSYLSRELDLQKNLENYVRVSFVKNHPMEYIARKEERISNPVILQIDKDIIFWEKTKFSNKNAARSDSSIGKGIDNFKNIRFDILKRRYFDLNESEKSYFQAEILVFEKIPIEFIKNIDRV